MFSVEGHGVLMTLPDIQVGHTLTLETPLEKSTAFEWVTSGALRVRSQLTLDGVVVLTSRDGIPTHTALSSEGFGLNFIFDIDTPFHQGRYGMQQIALRRDAKDWEQVSWVSADNWPAERIVRYD
jgi:hypothetical protein